jgi:hypothetical protein
MKWGWALVALFAQCPVDGARQVTRSQAAGTTQAEHLPTVRMPAAARPDQLQNRPSLLPYDPVAAPGATVTSSDGSARFTVLTPRLIRMESIKGESEHVIVASDWDGDAARVRGSALRLTGALGQFPDAPRRWWPS